MILLSIAAAMTQSGMRIVKVCSGPEAVEIIESLSPRWRCVAPAEAMGLLKPVPRGQVLHVQGYLTPEGHREWSSELRDVRPRGSA